MAAQGLCRDCDAAFVHPPVKGYIPCPLCSKTLERTSSLHGGAWFVVDGARSTYPHKFTIAPLADLARKSPRIRAFTIAEVAAKQRAESAAWDLRFCRDRLATADPARHPWHAEHLPAWRDAVAVVERKQDDAAKAAERATIARECAETGRPNPADFPDDEIGYYEALEYYRAGI